MAATATNVTFALHIDNKPKSILLKESNYGSTQNKTRTSHRDGRQLC